MTRPLLYIVFVCSIIAALQASPKAFGHCIRQECGRKKASETQLLTCNAYREAISVGKAGMVRVTRNVLTRVESDAFPNSIRAVIFQAAQYSWTAKPRTCVTAAGWKLAQQAVKQAVHEGPSGFLYYHRFDVHPRWSKPKYSICTGTTRFPGDPHVYFKDCVARGSKHRKSHTRSQYKSKSWVSENTDEATSSY